MGKLTDETFEAQQMMDGTDQKKESRNTDEVQQGTEDNPNEGIESSESEELSTENFMEMFEQSLKTIQEGELISGEIVQISKEFVLVDIGYKSEGQIPIDEFTDEDGNITAKIGDQIDVILERREDDEGVIHLSKEKAAKIKIWDDIKEIYEKDQTIQGKIISRLKGGMLVDIGLQAFLPGSQIDLKPVRDFDSLIGTEHEFKILKYNRRRSNIVLSRRAILELDRREQRDKTLAVLEEGAIVEGTVKNITEYGIFVDLGGIDGLLHITDISWGRISHPSELYNAGDKIKVKVLKFDREKERVSLGAKQLVQDPWLNANEKYPIDSKVKGHIVSLVDYGAFVEIEEGIEGLIHVSEMSWTRKIRHPSQIVKVGDEVEVVILNVDSANKRISLGLKQVEPNPWEVIGEKYPVGTTIEGKIKNITDFGVFIGIDEGIDGLVHISDISWTKRIKHPSEVFKKGQEIQAVVLNIDEEAERFSLGIKQLTGDPWDEIPRKYKPGTRITGTVTNITDFGVFVEIEEGIEGLIHISEVASDKGSGALSRYKVDDVIQAKVINVSRKDKKIGLSIKRLEESEERDIYASYLNNKQGATSNLGELIMEGMSQLASQDTSDDSEPADNLSEQKQEEVSSEEEGPSETDKEEQETISGDDKSDSENPV